MKYFYKTDNGIDFILGFNSCDVEREGKLWVVNFSNRKFSFVDSPMYSKEIFQDKEGQWQDKKGNKYKDIATAVSLPEVILVDAVNESEEF
jgi:hypothetical protein